MRTASRALPLGGIGTAAAFLSTFAAATGLSLEPRAPWGGWDLVDVLGCGVSRGVSIFFQRFKMASSSVTPSPPSRFCSYDKLDKAIAQMDLSTDSTSTSSPTKKQPSPKRQLKRYVSYEEMIGDGDAVPSRDAAAAAPKSSGEQEADSATKIPPSISRFVSYDKVDKALFSPPAPRSTSGSSSAAR